MKKLMIIGEFLLGIFSILVNVYTLFSAGANYFEKLPDMANFACIVFFILAGIVMVIASVRRLSENLRNASRHHEFEYQSEKFIRFFSEWYSQPGVIKIICDDLDWTNEGNDRRIHIALLQKSRDHNLKLLIGNGINAEVVQDLRKAGASVEPAPASLVDQYTFSTLSMDGSIIKTIVRDKRQNPPNGKIAFDEVYNKYIIGLLDALLKNNARRNGQ